MRKEFAYIGQGSCMNFLWIHKKRYLMTIYQHSGLYIRLWILLFRDIVHRGDNLQCLNQGFIIMMRKLCDFIYTYLQAFNIQGGPII